MKRKKKTDLISREEVKAKYKEQFMNSLVDKERNIDFSEYAEMPCERFNEFIDSIPCVVPEKGEYLKKEDVISAIDADSWNKMFVFFRSNHYMECFKGVINRLPTYSSPEMKKGKWIQNGTGYDDKPIYECSECGSRIEFGEDGTFNCCPYCKADMGGDKE